MKRLCLQFAAFASILALGFVVLVARSYREIEVEERSLARSYAEQVFEQVQARTASLLDAEDQRAFGEYRFLHAVPGERPGEASLVRSPVSRFPHEDPRGLVGYFQIDPDGAFSTPYLPSGRPDEAGFAPEERKARVDREDMLRGLTVSLQERVRAGGARPGASIDLGASSKELTVDYTDLSDEAAKLRAKAKVEEHRREEAARPTSTREGRPTQAELRLFESQRRPVVAVDRRARGITGTPTQVSIDPFQARLVEKRYIVFYRKLWLDQTLYLQGFVLDARLCFDWLMSETYPTSPLAGYAVASLNLDDDELARYGPPDSSGTGPPLFERAFGDPLSRFVWRARAETYPRLASRGVLAALAAIAGSVVALGLASIYRTAATQVRLSRKRQDLVSAVTHELRTPLTSIRMYAEMLEEGMVETDAKRLEYYRHISHEGARLSRLIENVLQLARLEKGTYRVEMQSRSPAADFEEIAHEIEALVERQGFRLVRSTPQGDLPAVSYDPDAVRQILLALLDNSMKFAAQAADRRVEMSLNRVGETVLWTWSDRGPGVPPGEMERIFETFYRVEGEATRRTKGTGIGLAVARMLAEAMGSRIEASNRPSADGGGLEVRLLLRSAVATKS